jgi:DNA-binding NarL/FixJ family response regulator
MEKLRILVVDDHTLFREGIVNILNAQPDMQVIAQASDGLEAVVLARSLRPDIVLMDIHMPGTDGIEATRLIKRDVPETYVLMLTVRDEDEKLFEAIKSGAQGYLLKTIRAQQLIDMLHAAQRGELTLSPGLANRILDEFRRLSTSSSAASTASPSLEPLTARERQILSLVARGATDREIAQELVISVYTVKAHIRSILNKLHVTSRHQAARLAQQQ